MSKDISIVGQTRNVTYTAACVYLQFTTQQHIPLKQNCHLSTTNKLQAFNHRLYLQCVR